MLENGLSYCDSRTATKEEFTADLLAFDGKSAAPLSAGGPVLFQDGDVLYCDGSELHNLVIGDTGSMKTLKFCLPLMYTLAMAGESMVVVDPKGELVRKFRPFLRKKRYKTRVLNWRSPSGSIDSWNCLGRVNELYRQGKQEEAMNVLNDLLEVLFKKRSTNDKDMFWNESAGYLALGLCKLILYAKQELSMKSLLEWRYRFLKDGTVEAYFHMLDSNSDIYQNLSGYMHLTAENTKSCIEATFDQLIGIFSASESLTEMMSENTFQMEELGMRRTAVFLVVPDEKTTYHFLATLFIKQAYEVLLEKAELTKGVLPVRVNFLLEEFCNIPRLNDIVPMLTAARSRRIRFHLIIQSYSQLVDKYTESIARTILDNCGNLIYLHTREISFLQYISGLTGLNEYGRPLVSVSRLLHLHKNETLIFHDRCYPYLVRDLPLIFSYPVELGAEMPMAGGGRL